MRFDLQWRGIVAVMMAVVTIGLIGCAGTTPGGGNDSGIPITDPYIIGQITAIEGNRILIESTPGQQAGDKSWLAISGSTRLFKQDGKLVLTITASDLAVGQQVSAWARGPIRESYPTQGDAQAVLVH